jgi:hypothetical protein
MQQHRGRRSLANQERRFARRVIIETSRADKRQGEQICMLSGLQVLGLVEQKYGSVPVDVGNVEKGEVLSDSRGEGTFQRLPRNRLDWSLAIGI